MTLDLLVDQSMRVVPDTTFTGWWGRLGSTDLLPFILLKDGRVDFGSERNTDQQERFGEMDILETKIVRGEPVRYQDPDNLAHLTIERITDMVTGASH